MQGKENEKPARGIGYIALLYIPNLKNACWQGHIYYMMKIIIN